jgi:phosphoglycerate kinase
MNVKNIQDIPVKGQRVLVRVDFNVPVKDGVILDDTRLRANIPTIKNLQRRRRSADRKHPFLRGGRKK